MNIGVKPVVRIVPPVDPVSPIQNNLRRNPQERQMLQKNNKKALDEKSKIRTIISVD